MIKDYNQMLYDLILKPIALDGFTAIYRNVIDEDYDSQPSDYIVYNTGISDIPRVYGDGKVLIRRCNCDITVNEKGDGNNNNAGWLIQKVEQQLVNSNIAYNKINVGYIENQDSMQVTFDFYLI